MVPLQRVRSHSDREHRTSGRLRRNAARIAVFWACAWTGLAYGGESPDATPLRLSLPIEVSGLPADGEPAPVSCSVDFTGMLQRLKVAGAVDEHTLRLHRLVPGGEVEEPVQFVAWPQARAGKRELLPGTSPQVSYLTERAADQTADLPRQAGELCWLARAGADGTQRYRLSFGVPRGGRFIQVPYAPQNLRALDGEGRATPIAAFPVMQIRPQWPLDGRLHLSEANRLVTSYHLGPTLAEAGLPAVPLRRPFLYPVNGPDGLPLTEFGKAHDPTGSHAHHYSLWIAHARVAGHDYWSETGGLIAHDRWERLEDGPVFCRVVQRARWVRDRVEDLRERRVLTVYRAVGDVRLLDLELEFSPAGAQPVELGQTTFGFLAVRVAQSMTPFDGGGEILNARGDRNEHAAHLKRAEWLDQSGPIAPGRPDPSQPGRTGPPRWGGIALFDHPDNPNHPTGWHCRNDGWAGAALCMEKPYTIQPGQSLHLRYRVCLHRHNAVEGRVGRHYASYRAQPAVRLGEPTRD